MKVNSKLQAGFSLVELMVVVAIIGILAAIAVPQFQKFQARARQAEGKSLLGAYYAAQKGFFSEWQSYNNSVQNIGFSAEGLVRYDVGVVVGVNPTVPNMPGSAVNCAVAAAPNCSLDGYCGAGVFANNCNIVANSAGVSPKVSVWTGALTPAAIAQAAFQAGAIGYPLVAATADSWVINEQKNLRQSNNGIQ